MGKSVDLAKTDDAAVKATAQRLQRIIFRLQRSVKRRKELEAKGAKRPTPMRFHEFDACFNCRRPFDAIRKKFHCHACSYVFCDECTRYFRDIPEMMYHDVRV